MLTQHVVCNSGNMYTWLCPCSNWCNSTKLCQCVWATSKSELPAHARTAHNHTAKDYNRMSADLSVLSPKRSNRSRNWVSLMTQSVKGLNWTKRTCTQLQGVYIHVRHRLQTDRVCRMFVWFFSGEDKCPITFLSAQSLSVFLVFFVTLGQHIRRSLFDPVTGCSSTTRSYIPLINTARAVFFQTALHSTGHWMALACCIG